MIILSILIPTIPERGEMFTRLFNEVHRQIAYMDTVHPTLGEIEVLVDDSKRFLDGGLSIGKKREALVKRATGKYLCFLDDDETIAPNYVEVLVRLAQSDCDVLTFNNISKMDNFWTLVRMRFYNTFNSQAKPGTIDRPPWHICPVKTVIAQSVPFPDSNYGEDWEWFEKVLNQCTDEEYSEAIIHQYNHSSKTSEADKITSAFLPTFNNGKWTYPNENKAK
jgi:glycosyltransferase involved in cell wall biosynthesis